MAHGRFRRPELNFVLDINTSTTVVSQVTQDFNGILHSILIKTPATVDSSATVAVDIIDSDGYTVYTKSGVAVNTRSVNVLTADTRVPICGVVTVRVTFSAAQAANRSTDVVLLIDRG